ncbi:UNVERIFIED_CONTAM: hypothetical protein RMT77_011826 [Armadillidium vulgare]
MKPTLLMLSKRDSYLNGFTNAVNHRSKNIKGGFNLKMDSYATHCYVCDNRVELSNLHCHLYFGHVKCRNCSRIITSCLKFSYVSISRSENNGKCTHGMLDWVFPPVDNLKRLWNKKDEAFDKSLISYLKSLQELGNTQPFKKAITYCSLYLKQRLYSRSKEEFWNIDNPLSTNPNKALTSTFTTFSTCIESPIHNKIAVKRNLNSKVSSGEKREYTQKVPLSENGLSDKALTTATATTVTTISTCNESPIQKIAVKRNSNSKISSGEKREYTEKVPLLPENGFSDEALTTTTTTISTCNESPIHKIAVKRNLNSKVSSGEPIGYSEVVPLLPENGFYLIKEQIIERCPNCDKRFNPQNLKFNTNNWLISISCAYCSLLIFFILNPPDGSKPKLTIVSSR